MIRRCQAPVLNTSTHPSVLERVHALDYSLMLVHFIFHSPDLLVCVQFNFLLKFNFVEGKYVHCSKSVFSWLILFIFFGIKIVMLVFVLILA